MFCEGNKKMKIIVNVGWFIVFVSIVSTLILGLTIKHKEFLRANKINLSTNNIRWIFFLGWAFSLLTYYTLLNYLFQKS